VSLARAWPLAVLLALAGAGVGLFGYLRLPHWGFIRLGDAIVPKWPGLAILPALALAGALGAGLASSRRAAARAAPRQPGLTGVWVLALAALLLVAEGALVAQSLNPEFDVVRWGFEAVATLLILIGAALRRRRASAAAGRLMIFAAVALAVATVFLPDPPLLIALAIVGAAGPFAIAWSRSRRTEKPPSTPVVTVDRDVAVGKVAGPHDR
jgi:hypothetical protein